MYKWFLCLCLVLAGCTPAVKPEISLTQDKKVFSVLIAEYENYLLFNGADQKARAELGVLQVIRSVEVLAQSLVRHLAPSQRSWVPEDIQPQYRPVSYDTLVGYLRTFVSDLEKARATLAQVNDPQFKTPLDFFQIALDYDANGVITENEHFETFTGSEESFPVNLDLADARWLIGYTHLTSSLMEIVLTYNWEVLFHALGPWVFETDTGPLDKLIIENYQDWVFPVVNASNSQKALSHLQGALEASRAMIQAADAETDDDLEWIPNPRQTSLTGLEVTPVQWEAWKGFLDRFGQILDGGLLLSVDEPGRGINLKAWLTGPRDIKVGELFSSSPTFFAPWIQEGPVASPRDWDELEELFGGNFLQFALWFN